MFISTSSLLQRERKISLKWIVCNFTRQSQLFTVLWWEFEWVLKIIILLFYFVHFKSQPNFSSIQHFTSSCILESFESLLTYTLSSWLSLSILTDDTSRSDFPLKFKPQSHCCCGLLLLCVVVDPITRCLKSSRDLTKKKLLTFQLQVFEWVSESDRKEILLTENLLTRPVPVLSNDESVIIEKISREMYNAWDVDS